MKVLVTGGTGFVGREVVRQLHEAGHQIRLLVRRRHTSAVQQLLELYPLEIWEGNVLMPDTLLKSIQGTDAVIHLVGIISEIRKQTFDNVHKIATHNMVKASLVAGARRFLHMSALGTRLNAHARYHQTKWAAEQFVAESQLNWTIFRPSLIYGPGDQFVNQFAHMAKWLPIMPFFGRKRIAFQPVAVEIVAQCFVKALDEPRAIRERFDVCGPEWWTIEKIIREIVAITNQKCLLVHIPNDLDEVVAAVMEFIFPIFLGKASPLTRDQLIMLSEDNPGEPRWTNELFKLEHPDFVAGITRYLKPALDGTQTSIP